jgi:hypothetical protein
MRSEEDKAERRKVEQGEKLSKVFLLNSIKTSNSSIKLRRAVFYEILMLICGEFTTIGRNFDVNVGRVA